MPGAHGPSASAASTEIGVICPRGAGRAMSQGALLLALSAPSGAERPLLHLGAAVLARPRPCDIHHPMTQRDVGRVAAKKIGGTDAKEQERRLLVQLMFC
jgi:hypothetical protein